MNDKKNSYAIILAGGSGTRFWPMSRRSKPKQFLDVTGQRTLLQETLKRLKPKFESKNIFIVTNERYKKEILKQTGVFRIPPSNIMLEPSGKNTAPAICWAAAAIHQRNSEAILGIFPSDHLITQQNKFLGVLNKAFRLAEHNYLVTMGIVPQRPETGYGYIKTAALKFNGEVIQKVIKFTEKPNLKKAQQFLEEKNYYWNSGMFVWRAAVILEEFKQHLPDVYWAFSSGVGQSRVNKFWAKLPSISIDYGILEKSTRCVALPAVNIGWSDLGSWEALDEILPKDKNKNIIKGDVISLESNQNLIWATKRLIACVGVNNLVVIDTPEALLICQKNMSQKVKDVVGVIEKNAKRKDSLL